MSPRLSRPAFRGRPAVICILLLLCCTPAWGHGGDEAKNLGSVHPVLGALPAALQGVRVQLRETLAPQLLIANTTGQALTVFDSQGRAFLRIGPKVARGDLGAAAFHRSNTLMAPASIPADASTTARWHTVAPAPHWGWFDLRLRTGQVDVPHTIADANQRARIGEWSIPVRIGDVDTHISGYFEYVPAPHGVTEARIEDSGELADRALIRAMTGARPGLFLLYRGDEPLVILGIAGEPFLRFTGVQVEVNRHSPTWARVASAGKPKPIPAAEGAQPLWARVSRSAGYGWIEPRAAFPGTVARDDDNQATTVKRWQIPYRIGASESAIVGITEWLPVTPQSS